MGAQFKWIQCSDLVMSALAALRKRPDPGQRRREMGCEVLAEEQRHKDNDHLTVFDCGLQHQHGRKAPTIPWHFERHQSCIHHLRQDFYGIHGHKGQQQTVRGDAVPVVGDIFVRVFCPWACSLTLRVWIICEIALPDNADCTQDNHD